MNVTSVGYQAQILPALPDAAIPKWLVENRELIRSIQNIDAAQLFGEGHELTFALDPQTRRPVVRVLRQDTREVVWQTPAEYVLRIAAFMSEQEHLRKTPVEEGGYQEYRP